MEAEHLGSDAGLSAWTGLRLEPALLGSIPTLPSPGHPNTPETLDQDLKAYLMMMVEDIKKDFNNSLKEIQQNTAKQLEDLKEETQKLLK